MKLEAKVSYIYRHRKHVDNDPDHYHIYQVLYLFSGETFPDLKGRFKFADDLSFMTSNQYDHYTLIEQALHTENGTTVLLYSRFVDGRLLAFDKETLSLITEPCVFYCKVNEPKAQRFCRPRAMFEDGRFEELSGKEVLKYLR